VAFARVGFCCVEVKPFGPVHAYVAVATSGVERAMVEPSQYGPPFDAAGVAGFGVTLTDVVPAADVQPPTVTVTEYVPPSAAVAFARVGFWRAEVKPFGPVHAYVAPATVGVESEIVAPSQNGPPLLAVGVAGIEVLTATLVEPAADAQPFTVTVTEYVPPSAAVALARVGFWSAEVKPFGPVHAYVAFATVGVDKAIVEPAQYGPPFDAKGVAGTELTTTDVVPPAEGQPFTVTVTKYVPALASVAFVRVGFWSDDVKPFGPVQWYAAPLTVGVESEIVPPTQYGPPFDGDGVEGIGFTTTLVVPAGEVQPLTVTVSEYVPASAAVAFARVGFWSAEVKPFGPVQAYVAFAIAGVDSAIVEPAQNGPLFDTDGAAGMGLTVTAVAADGALMQPFVVVVTV